MGRDALIVYAAGYLDGEGHLNVERRTVKVDTTEPSPLYLLRDLFGGRVKEYVYPDRSYWRWAIYGDSAKDACKEFWNLMTTKREPAFLLAYVS